MRITIEVKKEIISMILCRQAKKMGLEVNNEGISRGAKFNGKISP